MSEKQETVHVVLRGTVGSFDLNKPVKVFDDRKDARAYARHLGARTKNYYYFVNSCKKG